MKGIRDPQVLATNVRYALMSVPVIWIGESFVNAVIEILVVREKNVTADVVELMLTSV